MRSYAQLMEEAKLPAEELAALRAKRKADPNDPNYVKPRPADKGQLIYLDPRTHLPLDPQPTPEALAEQRREVEEKRKAAEKGMREWMDNYKKERAEARRENLGCVQCSYFSRFGRCTRAGGECLYAHDAEKVAICQKFLHGVCDDAACPLSHVLAAERLPTCRLFLQGVCVTPDCAFAHVHHGAGTDVCEAFSKGGYCAAGAACAKRHELTCELAAAGGGPCPLGELCKLRRPRPKPEPSDADAPPPDAKPPPVVWSNSPSTRPQFPSA